MEERLSVTLWFKEGRTLKSGKVLKPAFRMNGALTINQFNHFQSVESGGSFVAYPIYSKTEVGKMLGITVDTVTKASTDKSIEYAKKAREFSQKANAENSI